METGGIFKSNPQGSGANFRGVLVSIFGDFPLCKPRFKVGLYHFIPRPEKRQERPQKAERAIYRKGPAALCRRVLYCGKVGFLQTWQIYKNLYFLVKLQNYPICHIIAQIRSGVYTDSTNNFAVQRYPIPPETTYKKVNFFV